MRPRLLNTAVLVWVGNLSYSLYLWNMPFTNPGIKSWVITFPQNLVFTVLAATVSFYAVEQPIRKLRERRAKRVVSPHRLPHETRDELVEVGVMAEAYPDRPLEHHRFSSKRV